MSLRAVNQPVSWWGWHGYSQPRPMSIAELIAAGNLSAEMAAVTWIALEKGASIVVPQTRPHPARRLR